MKHISFRPISFLLGVAALTIVSSIMSVRAETASTGTSFERSEDSAVTVSGVEPAVTSVDQLASEPTVTQISEDTVGSTSVQQTNSADINGAQADSQILQPEVPEVEVIDNEQQALSDATQDAIAAEPMPGTVATSAAPLTTLPEFSALPAVSSEQTDTSATDTTVAQTEVDPGRTTRGGASYVGIGGNLGLGGDTALGRGSFVINGKLGLTRTISFRPAAVIGDDTVFLLPVTYDFLIQRADPFEPVRFAPFVGGGVAISTDEDDNIGFLITGGVDVPLSREFVANASLNVGFLEDTTDVGLIVGVGYTFAGF